MSKHSILLAALLAMSGQLGSTFPAKPPRIYTDADQQRREKAEAKRQRKAAKRAASKGGAA
jgi:hypothetical protein